MPNFIKVPAKLSYASDIEQDEMLGKKSEGFDGFSIISVREIEFICADNEISSIYFKSGAVLEVNLTLDVLEAILEKY